jgi:alpha-galactosidase/6-phospho-beta-glucosidase family protein
MPKIVVIGAGSASFGLNTLESLLRSKKLRGSEIALVDLNPKNLERMTRLAEHGNAAWDGASENPEQVWETVGKIFTEIRKTKQ